MAIRLVSSGQHVRFLDVSIGSVFFAHGEFWTRINHDVATKVSPSLQHGSACNFVTDPEDEFVERVEITLSE